MTFWRQEGETLDITNHLKMKVIKKETRIHTRTVQSKINASGWCKKARGSNVHQGSGGKSHPQVSKKLQCNHDPGVALGNWSHSEIRNCLDDRNQESLEQNRNKIIITP